MSLSDEPWGGAPAAASATAPAGILRSVYRRWRAAPWWKRWLVQMHVLVAVLFLAGFETVRGSRTAVDEFFGKQYHWAIMGSVAGPWRGFSFEGPKSTPTVWFDRVCIFKDPSTAEELHRFNGGVVGRSLSSGTVVIRDSARKEERARVAHEMDAGWARVRERMLRDRQRQEER